MKRGRGGISTLGDPAVHPAAEMARGFEASIADGPILNVPTASGATAACPPVSRRRGRTVSAVDPIWIGHSVRSPVERSKGRDRDYRDDVEYSSNQKLDG